MVISRPNISAIASNKQIRMQTIVKKHIIVFTCLVGSIFYNVHSHAIAADVLLYKSNLQYLGAFRMPRSQPLFAWSTGTIAYNPTNDSLFIVGAGNAPSSTDNNQVAEISIPATLVSSPDIDDLPIATMVQSFADITEGNRKKIGINGSETGASGVKIGGLLAYGTKLIGSAYSYFDASYSAIRSHFTSGLTLAQQGDFLGMYQVGGHPTPVPQAGFVAGFMTIIPAAWQQKLGGTVLSGQSGIPIVTRTSYGPAVFSFDPADLSGDPTNTENYPVPATALIYYDKDHRTLGEWSATDPANIYVSIADNLTGIVFPTGSKSILFFGVHGSENCYGIGTSDQAKAGTTSPDGEQYCYDPFNASKGTHGYPLKPYVWAYNADDIAAVKAGTKTPWEVMPYSVWDFTLPTTSYNGTERATLIGGAAYDPVKNRIYVTQNRIEGQYDVMPIIHVFQVDGTTQQDLVAPVIKSD